jgi:hypothetical protein
MDSSKIEAKGQPEGPVSSDYPEALLEPYPPQSATLQSRLLKFKSALIFIIISISVIVLPLAILPPILLVAARLRLDTSDPFVYFAVIAGLLPGICLILLPRINRIFKILAAALYLVVGFPVMAIYAIVLFCVIYADCL